MGSNAGSTHSVGEDTDDRATGSEQPRLHPIPVHDQTAIDPNHPLIRIDERLDFACLVELSEGCHRPDFGRRAIDHQVTVKTLLICPLYNIASFRRSCSETSENLAYHWVCFLTIVDPVCDRSSISHFIDRIGRDGFAAIFNGLDHDPLRMMCD